jgi:acyl-CoA thioesterase
MSLFIGAMKIVTIIHTIRFVNYPALDHWPVGSLPIMSIKQSYQK